MASVEQIFSEYVVEHRGGGEADPRAFLARVEDGDRAELAALIDGYLARSPGRAWNLVDFAGSLAERASEEIAAEWELDSEEGAHQGWGELLPALRNRAQIMRREVVERLAQGLGHPAETASVASYYHQMELGQLPAEGVSNRVLDVLSEILGESTERLRAAGSAVGEAVQADGIADLSFARAVKDDARYLSASGSESPSAEMDLPAEPSEIDRLFTGGPDAG